MIGKDRDVPVTEKKFLRADVNRPRHLYLMDPQSVHHMFEEEVGFTIHPEDGPFLGDPLGWEEAVGVATVLVPVSWDPWGLRRRSGALQPHAVLDDITWREEP